MAKTKGIKKIKAITSTPNKKSIAFHTGKIGMQLIGKENEEGIKVVKNYSGLNRDRVVFERQI